MGEKTSFAEATRANNSTLKNRPSTRTEHTRRVHAPSTGTEHRRRAHTKNTLLAFTSSPKKKATCQRRPPRKPAISVFSVYYGLKNSLFIHSLRVLLRQEQLPSVASRVSERRREHSAHTSIRTHARQQTAATNHNDHYDDTIRRGGPKMTDKNERRGPTRTEDDRRGPKQEEGHDELK